ncbi:MAG: CPBP family intramembrane metalloprotease [Prolixibacteraceae bacterium]|jgi:hypothetical protein|nr:CPBP family intramembrane metalloprotease [Prolixibacteraceae bacterium]
MKKTSFYKKLIVWLCLFVIAIGSSVFLYFNFEKANPLVNISVEMDRIQALNKAASLASEFKLGPVNYRQAATFYNDRDFQNYTELEGGGLDVFNSVLNENRYNPYQWKVRHFKEKEVNEVTFSFTPSGDLYGFAEIISEELEGAALSSESALKIAKAGAVRWDTDLSYYSLVEQSVDEKVSGRLDHEFVFERKDKNVNESKFRIAIKVSGNKVSSIRNFVRIPDDFERRFTEMRSANNLIGVIGQALLFIVYGLIGIGLGIFFLSKRKYLLWRKALYWSLGIGFGTGILYVLNVMPLLWFNYDTSIDANTFMGKRILGGLLESVAMGSFVFISAMAGEGLGRFVFKDQIQLWKVWSKDAGGSTQILGQTMGAYLFVPIVLAIDVLYYLITTKYFGWWNPAGTLSDPDILAQNLPWFGSIAISLQAGFWEEIICRAIPLAGVFLLVRNLKTKNFWMILTLLAQTIIFGMLHANYPQSPSYARVLEMVVPFLIFGLVYLRFGLLPVIIAHYAIDVFWISLPLWVASSPGIWIDRSIIIILLFVPIWVVAFWRIKNKKWNSVPGQLRNAGWIPPVVLDKVKIEEEGVNRIIREPSFLKLKWLIPSAIIGIVLWAVFTFPTQHETPSVELNRKQAVEIAQKVVQDNFDFSANEWTTLSSIKNRPASSHQYVWQEYNKSYTTIQNTFLNKPYWLIRFAKIEAPVEERAEEFNVKLGVDGTVLAFKHKIPEKREGAMLTKDEALVLAKNALVEFNQVNLNGLKPVLFTPELLDSRKDWIIEFSDTLNSVLSEGQGRYKVGLAGDEINSISKYVFVPETWKRDFEKKMSSLGIFTLISNLLLYAIIILGIVLGFINWSRKNFSLQLFILFAIVYISFSLLGAFNSWNDVVSQYTTGLPYSNFISITLIGLVVVLVFLGLGVAVIGGFSCEMSKSDVQTKNEVFKALLIGLLLAGIQSAKMSFMPQLSPSWLPLNNLNAFIPSFGIVSDQIQRFVFNPAFAMILFYLSNKLTNNNPKLKGLAFAIIFVASFVASGVNANSIWTWNVIGACSGVVFILLYLLLKNHLSWMPIVFIVTLILDQVEYIAANYYSEVVLGSILAILVWGIASILWYYGMKKCSIIK